MSGPRFPRRPLVTPAGHELGGRLGRHYVAPDVELDPYDGDEAWRLAERERVAGGDRDEDDDRAAAGDEDLDERGRRRR